MPAAPVRLRPNLIDHFYRGGRRIADLRGVVTTSPRQPEEWVAATVSRDGPPTLGLSSTEDGSVLRDLVADDPVGWTGTPGAWPGDTGLLLKLLDAGQRLPVHVHPDRAFAARHLDCPYGKTEAWLVLDAEPGAAVHLGWDRDVDPADVARARDEQDGTWMLERMHRLPVRRGDAFLVPAGTPHAIGAGVFVAEAQEPTDFSILLRLDLATEGAELDAGFAALVVLDGTGELAGGHGSTALRRGEVLAVPAAAGDWTVAGDARVLVARPGVSRG